MERRRLWLVHALLFVIISGSLFDLVTGREHWPFSCYAMYAGARRRPSLTALWLFGVTGQAPAREIPLTAPRYLQPFALPHLQDAFRRMQRGPQPRAYRQALRDCLRRYEALRRAGRHDGPPLRGIRLYRVYWTVDSRARNVDHPDRKELIAELVEG